MVFPESLVAISRRIESTPLPLETAEQCRELVFTVAREFGIPPVHVTSHIRNLKADKARKKVMQEMIHGMGLPRWRVAEIFNRDLRRVRASVLG